MATGRAWDLKECFDHFWHYKSILWAGAFLDYWTWRARRSRLEPMKKVARMLRRHEKLLLNWFKAKGGGLQWGGRRPQQQNPSGDQTLLRIPHLQSHGNGPISQLGPTPRTRKQP